MCREVSWPFGRLVYWFGRQNSGTEITLFKILLFHLYLNKKYVKVAINDFTIHLIISKWFRRRKCRQKQCDKKMSKPKKKWPTKVFFMYLKRSRSWKCLLIIFNFFRNLLQAIKRRKWFTLLRVIPCVLLTASFQLRSLRSSHEFIAIQILFLNMWIL